MSQKKLILNLFSDGTPKSIDEVQEQTNILRPNIRRILGQGTLNGEFKRIEKGIYVLSTADGKTFAVIESNAAEDAVPRLVAEGRKFDMLFFDPAYFSRALIGGNRGIKEYGFIMPKEFALVMQAAAKLLRTDRSHCYLMLSGAVSAQKDMQLYLDAAIDAGLKVVSEGGYQKLFSDGKPVTNVRGNVAEPERLILLSRSGEVEREFEVTFRFARPKGYQSEKAPGLLRALIEQATRVGEWIGDFFAGSGVTGEQAILAGRNVYLIERTESVVSELIFPRVQKAIASYNNLL